MSHDPGDEHHPPRTAYPVGMIQVGDTGTFTNGYEVVVSNATEPEHATLVITTVTADEITPMVPVWQRWIGHGTASPEAPRCPRIDANIGGSWWPLRPPP